MPPTTPTPMPTPTPMTNDELLDAIYAATRCPDDRLLLPRTADPSSSRGFFADPRALADARLWTALVEHAPSDTAALRVLTALHERLQAEPHAPLDGGAPYEVLDAAAARGFLATVTFLHTTRPQDGATTGAMDLAAAHGHVAVLEFLHAQRTEGCTHAAIDEAAANGHVDAVRFLYEVAGQRLLPNAAPWAASRGHLRVLEYLDAHAMSHAPQSLWTPDVLRNAAHFGRLGVLRWLARQHPELRCPTVLDAAAAGYMLASDQGPDPDEDPDEAVPKDAVSVERRRRLRVVRFLHEHDMGGATSAAMDAAAGHGDVAVVAFLHEHRTEGCTTAAMDQAAAVGSLETVTFLHEHRTEGATTEAMDQAAAQGHLAVVEFLHAHRREGCTSAAVEQAASNGHAHVVAFLHRQRRDDVVAAVTSETLAAAARGDHVEVVRYLLEHELVAPDEAVLNDQLIIDCAASGALEVLRYLHEGHQHVALNPDRALLKAIEYDRQGLTQYLLERRLAQETMDSETRDKLFRVLLQTAARNGRRELLELLDARRRELSSTHPGSDSESFVSRALDLAAGAGQLEIVEYLHSHGHGGCTQRAMDTAAENGHLAVVAFLHAHRTEGCTPKAMDGAARGGHVAVVRFLHFERSEGCTTDALDGAAARGHVRVVEFLLTHRSEGYTPQAIAQARKQRHAAVLALFPAEAVKVMCHKKAKDGRGKQQQQQPPQQQ